MHDRTKISMLVARLLLAFALLIVPAPAWAFCGFYVSGADSGLFNDATMVVMMRKGDTTVLSMQNHYEGPPEDFALVVPVPQVLKEDQVKTLKDDIFDKVDRLASPRLVEYWEQDPCQAGGIIGSIGSLGVTGMGRGGGGAGFGAGMGKDYQVKVEAEFDVGEYNIVILSAEESNGLERWLRDKEYNIPEGAAAVLKPYIEGGMYFFVARVDADRVKFDDGQAMLSPLRFHYTSKDFQLPVRLGLLNARGEQDLIVHILAPGQRYEVANYPNVTIPTNLVVEDAVRERFGPFYAALLDRTMEENPKAVVTEYAWQATKCDPCPPGAVGGGGLKEKDLVTLGADVFGMPDPRTILFESGPLEASGGLDATRLRRVIGARSRAINYCHQRELRTRPETAGSLDLTFEISPEGRVTDVSSTGSLDSEAVKGCVTRLIERMRFPESEDGEATAVRRLPLTFAADRNIGLIARGGRGADDWVLTRLHARHGPESLGQDLVFRQAPPLVGGRGMPSGEEGIFDERGAVLKDEGINQFQGRYAILHGWQEKIGCEAPTRGRWGGRPPGDDDAAADPSRVAPSVSLAPRTAFVERRGVELDELLRDDDSLETLKSGPTEVVPEEEEVTDPAPTATATLTPAPMSTPMQPVSSPPRSRCAVTGSGAPSPTPGVLLALVAALGWSRRLLPW